MCPMCLTSAAVVVAATTSGAGALGLIALRLGWLQRFAQHDISGMLRRKS